MSANDSNETVYGDNVARTAIRHYRQHYGITTGKLATAMTFAGYPMTNGTARTLEHPGDHTVSNYGPLNRPMIDAFARVFNVPRAEICPDELYYDTSRVKPVPHRKSNRVLKEWEHYPDGLPPLDYTEENPAPVIRCEHERELLALFSRQRDNLCSLADLHRKSPISDRCAECQNPYPCQTSDTLNALVEELNANVPTS